MKRNLTPYQLQPRCERCGICRATKKCSVCMTCIREQYKHDMNAKRLLIAAGFNFNLTLDTTSGFSWQRYEMVV